MEKIKQAAEQLLKNLDSRSGGMWTEDDAEIIEVLSYFATSKETGEYWYEKFKAEQLPAEQGEGELKNKVTENISCDGCVHFYTPSFELPCKKCFDEGGYPNFKAATTTHQ